MRLIFWCSYLPLHTATSLQCTEVHVALLGRPKLFLRMLVAQLTLAARLANRKEELFLTSIINTTLRPKVSSSGHIFVPPSSAPASLGSRQCSSAEQDQGLRTPSDLANLSGCGRFFQSPRKQFCRKRAKQGMMQLVWNSFPRSVARLRSMPLQRGLARIRACSAEIGAHSTLPPRLLSHFAGNTKRSTTIACHHV